MQRSGIIVHRRKQWLSSWKCSSSGTLILQTMAGKVSDLTNTHAKNQYPFEEELKLSVFAHSWAQAPEHKYPQNEKLTSVLA